MKLYDATRINVLNLKYLILAGLTCAVSITIPSNVIANDASALMIKQNAEAIRCVGFEMRDEIKTHFRHSKGYAKMLVVDAQIRVRSAAVSRRISRNPCYGGFDRDVQKLNDLTCELGLLCEQAVIRASRCLDRPIPGDTQHIADRIFKLNCLVGQLMQHCSPPVIGIPIGIPVQNFPAPYAPTYSNLQPQGPAVAPRPPVFADQAPQIAPGPVETFTDRRSPLQKPTLEGPLDGAKTDPRSVLEK